MSARGTGKPIVCSARGEGGRQGKDSGNSLNVMKPNLANVKRGNVERGRDDGRQNGRRVGGNAEYAGMTAV